MILGNTNIIRVGNSRKDRSVEKNMNKELKNIFGNEGDLSVKVNEDRSAVLIDWGKMYSHPELSFTILKNLSEFFGTDNIKAEQYSFAGCETCDYGSSYGHEITVSKITKNQDIESFVVRDEDM